jgi:tRNA(fMet)-specific endonuclease VapC
MMIETRIAKLFKNGASQAVRLPSDFRFEGDEVYVTRDDATGDVVLSNRPGAKTWNEFFELLHEVDVPADFMAERPLNVLPQERGIFDDGVLRQQGEPLAMLHMLDTDTASYLIKGKSRAIEAKLAALMPSMVCISVMTRAELQYGLKRLAGDHRLHLAVRQFLKIVRILPWDADAADWYAEIRHQLVSTGQPIGELDMMIAAHSLSAGAVLVTNNSRHYERIAAPLILDNWA